MSLPTFTRVIPTEPLKRPIGGGLRPKIPEYQKEIVGDAIRRARKAKRLTQTQLGTLSGLTKKLVCLYETAAGMPCLPNLFALALALDLDLNALARQFKSESEAQMKG